MMPVLKRFVLFTTLVSLISFSAVAQAPTTSPSSPKFFPVVSSVTSELGYIDETGRMVIPHQFEIGIGAPYDILPNMEFSEGLVPVSVNGKGFGYVNQRGEFVIEPQFSEADIFSDGLALVMTLKPTASEWYKERVFSYINVKGEPVIVLPSNLHDFPVGNTTRRFKDGYALAYDSQIHRIGFINKTGQFAIGPQFDDARPFKEGLAAVLVGEKWGFIDKQGKLVIAPTYKEVGDFSEGWAAVELKRERLGFIDKTGRLVLSTKHWFMADDAGLFKPGTRWGYRCEEGTEDSDSGYVPAFSEGLYPVPLWNGFGYINKNGRVVIDGNFDAVSPFSSGIAVVRIGSRYNFIDKKGRFVFRKYYRYASAFHDGLALVFFAWSSHEGKGCTSDDNIVYGYINRHGKIVFLDNYSYWVQFVGDEYAEQYPAVNLTVESDPPGAQIYVVPWTVWKFQREKSLEGITWLMSRPTSTTFTVQQQKYMVVLKADRMPLWMTSVPVTDQGRNLVRWVRGNTN